MADKMVMDCATGELAIIPETAEEIAARLAASAEETARDVSAASIDVAEPPSSIDSRAEALEAAGDELGALKLRVKFLMQRKGQ